MTLLYDEYCMCTTCSKDRHRKFPLHDCGETVKVLGPHAPTAVTCNGCIVHRFSCESRFHVHMYVPVA